MSKTRVQIFFLRRLVSLLRDRKIFDYNEDWNSLRVSFVLTGSNPLDQLTVNKIRELFNASLVTLTIEGNSLRVTIHQVEFPLFN